MGFTKNLSGFISAKGLVTPPLTDDMWSYYLLVMGRPLGLCSAPISPSPSVCSYQCICCQKSEGAGEGKRKRMESATTSQYQVAFKISATVKAIPPRCWRGRAVLYQRCQSSSWHNPLDPWWDHFSQVLLDRLCSCLDICCLTGPKLRVFDRLTEKHPFNKSPR